MEIEFAGAAREVTGSCHILRVNDRSVLLDCGLFQGHPAMRTKNRVLPCPIEEIDAVVAPRASRSLRPAAVSRESRLFEAIDATTATLIVRDHARRQRAHPGERLRVPDRHGRAVSRRLRMRDATRVGELMQLHAYEESFDVCAGVRARFRCGAHRRLRVDRDRGDEQIRRIAPDLLRRHRPCRAADHP